MIDNELVVGTVHDLRVPLNGIKGHIHYLRNYIDDETVTQELNIIEKSCQSMEKLINTILDYSKLSQGSYILDNREFSTKELIDDIENQARANANIKGIELVCSISGRVPERLISDSFRLEMLIGNLVSNSFKFTQIGYIGVHVDCESVDEQHAMLEISVVDTGNGIDVDRADTVFEAYSQAGYAAKVLGGTGLGLYVIKQFALLMGGDIVLDNRPGDGCAFKLKVMVGLIDGYQVNEGVADESATAFINNIYALAKEQKKFGSVSNTAALRKVIIKLRENLESKDVLAAENDVASIKSLLAGSEENMKRLGLKLAMSVRSSDMRQALEILKMIEEMYEKN